ncbi:MAG: hypothetical protein ACSLEW_08840, partial [Nocardioides sp.]
MADPTSLGFILEMDRGSLPFALIHGESLVACAAWAAGEAGVQLVDASLDWDAVAEYVEADPVPVVLHDPLCPMTPPDFIASCVEVAGATGVVVVGTRPVTDSVKQVVDGFLVGDVDRDALSILTSPIVIPALAVAAIAETGGLVSTDFSVLAGWLAERWEVVAVPAPAAGRRVATIDDVTVLEALTTPGPGYAGPGFPRNQGKLELGTGSFPCQVPVFRAKWPVGVHRLDPGAVDQSR